MRLRVWLGPRSACSMLNADHESFHFREDSPMPDSSTPGPQRRTVVKTGMGFVAVAASGFTLASGGIAAAATSSGTPGSDANTADATLSPTEDWRRYVYAPKNRN